MIIYRNGTKDKWVYTDKNNKVIKDKDILEYIKNLSIPPAYQKTEIFYEKNPKMLYFGYDEAGRKQQIYSKKHRENADKKKFKALIDFGKKMPQMLLKMQEHIKSPNHTKEKNISLILRITALCGFRIGQLKYHKLYNSIGLSTLMKKHLKFTGSKLEIKFVGKKGVLNDCIVEDKLLVSELKRISVNKAAGDFLFTYRDKETNEDKLITAIDVNDWLKGYNEEFTTKFFRTFEVNVVLIEALAGTSPAALTENQRKKKVTELMKEISCAINNTPGICRKSYITPELVNLYIEHPRKYQKEMIDNNNSARVNFIKFLERVYG